MLPFVAITAALSVVANLVIKRVSIATTAAVVASIAINVVHESWGRWAELGIDDLVFWGPMLVLSSGVVAGVASLAIAPIALAIKVAKQLNGDSRSDPAVTSRGAISRALLRVL